MGKVVANGFSPSKCYVLQVCRSMNPIIHPYTMLDQTLQSANHQPYLGVTLSEDLDWRTHILINIRIKTNSALGFVKKNLHRCPQKVKDQAYKSLVRPTFEYGGTVWIRIEYMRNHGLNRSSAGQHASYLHE